VIEESVLSVHKYNVPTFSPFAITNYPLMTFHVLSVNMDIQPSLANFLVEIRIYLDLEHVLPLSTTIGFHCFALFLPFSFQQFCMVHHHPTKLVQNHLEHNLENVSYGAWHEMKPLNLPPKTRKHYLQKESKHLVTHYQLHLLPDFSHVVHLLVSLELCSLSSDALSSHNSNTLSFQVWIWICPSYNSCNSLSLFLYHFVFP
jgi:hypothetical protein